MPPRKKTAAVEEAIVVEDVEQDDDSSPENNDGHGEDFIAPLFADAPNQIAASRVKNISLKRRGIGAGRAVDVVMDMVIDPETQRPFAFDPYKTTKSHIGRSFGPATYIVTPFDENWKLCGARYEFEITPDVVVNGRQQRARGPSPTSLGFNVPEEEPEDAPEVPEEPEEPAQREDRGYSIEEVLGARDRMNGSNSNSDITGLLLREVLKRGNAPGGDKGAIDLALKLHETMSNVREAAGIQTPTAQNMIASINAQHELVVQGLKEQIEDLRRAAKKFDERREADADEAKAERKRLILEHETTIKKLTEAHEETIKELKKRATKEYDEEVDRLKTLAKEERKRLQAEIDEKDDKLRTERKEHSEALSEARKEKSGVVSEKDDEKKRVREQAERDVRAAQAEADAAAVKRRDDIRAVEKSFEEKIANLERDLAAARKENIKLTKELAEIPEQTDDGDGMFPKGTPGVIKQWAPPLMKAGADFLQNSAKNSEKEQRDRERHESDLRRARQEADQARARIAELEARAAQAAAQPVSVPAAAFVPPAPAPTPAPVSVPAAAFVPPAEPEPVLDPPMIAPAPADTANVPPPPSPTMNEGTTVATSGGAEFAE